MTADRAADRAADRTADTVHDVVGIGIGPFNLGLACLTDPIADLDAVFLDAADGFAWHHGMMLDDATIQVPFLADLVTMADPTSPFSFLAWLKETGRLYPFYIREDFHPLRSEYDAYCRWAADRLDTLRWGRRVTAVEHDPVTDTFTVHAETDQGPETYRAHHVVVGIGTEPSVPAPLRGIGGPAVHSAEFLPNRNALRDAGSIAVVGSGQSAAEVYRELLEDIRQDGYRLDWITRSPRFFPMEDTKLTLEMTSPEYTDHFHGLPEAVRDRLGREQRGLYKGISADLVDDLYDQLYRISARGPVPTTLRTETSVVDAAWLADRGTYRLTLRHEQLDQTYEHEVEQLVLATGYTPRVPRFLDPVEHLVARDSRGRLAVARDHHVDTLGGRIWVQNAEEHTHGLTAPDLGMGAWRNASIIRSVTGRPVYGLEARIAFQEFGLPASEQSTPEPSTAHPGAAERAPARPATERAEVSA
ncbi:lysine N(6)-hydroxylase/L-ornithine N(5)-oxygenase family protein [Curtobacterium poinsettiae]|uniref:lysine N(6)-hydroxylase/L-ornithine N(5)-oxygenase family protein n=1 Tax=Curtobacterium TaxID=2034 RepID=UPI0012F0B0A5|nr:MULTISPECIES: SidA/IucD/PvdA family monooxygenase [Curtobacterium]MCS6573872.1 SidA/IucD/PvdA family monooxygenase [Curtobacterium flaccumfaciens pv. flaccumfaciens]MCU0116417.1 SidA/IucD/PvdA family monooxygenase [Curtobacterium flaccumfaciens]VXC10910.1 Alcaligin biosynthesis enzyme [Curtobacterium sp. 8I-2]